MKSNAGKIVVILPGGIWQNDLIEFYKEKGHPVYIVDSHTTKSALSASGHVRCDMNDSEGVYFAIQNNFKTPYIIASDQSVQGDNLVSVLCRRFGLECNNGESISRFSINKSRMYHHAESLQIPVVRHDECRDVTHVQVFFESWGKKPIVVKPDNSINNQGFRVISAAEEIKEAYTYARKFSKSRTVIAQQYIEADDQVTVEGFCQHKKHLNLMWSSKGNCWNTSATDSLRWPAQNISQAMIEKILLANDMFVNLSGLDHGITHAEYMINSVSGEFWLSNIVAHGGNFKIGRDVVRLVTGFDTYEQLYAIKIGSPKPLLKPEYDPRAVILQFYSPQDMESVSPWKLSQVKNIDNVYEFNFDYLSHSFGGESSNGKHSYAIIEADTMSAAENVLTQVNVKMGLN